MRTTSRLELDRAERLRRLDLPPASQVAWHARLIDGSDTDRPLIVLARLWFEARNQAAVALGCAPEKVVVTRS